MRCGTDEVDRAGTSFIEMEIPSLILSELNLWYVHLKDFLQIKKSRQLTGLFSAFGGQIRINRVPLQA